MYLPALAADSPKTNFQDHILPVFHNACLNCHNPDKKKGGLDLSNYAAAMAGSDGEKVISPGNPDDSLLYKTIAHLDEPKMPRGGSKLPDKDIQLVRQWIASGALETASGKPAASTAPRVDLSVVAPIGKPAAASATPAGLPRQLIAAPNRPGPVLAMAASPWAPILAIGSTRQVILLNTETTGLFGVLPFPEGDVSTVRFSRNGNILLVAGGVGAKSGKAVLFDVASGHRLAGIGDEYDEVLCADLISDQSLVVIGATSRLVKVYSTADGKVRNSIKKHTDWVTAVTFSPDGKLLASGDRAGNLHVWDVHGGYLLYSPPAHKAGVTAIAFRDDSRVLASASEDGTVKLWNASDGSQYRSISAHAGGVTWVDFAHDGRLVSTGRDRSARVFAADGTPAKALEAFPDIALRACFAHDGKRVFAGDFTGLIRGYGLPDGKSVASLTITTATARTEPETNERLSNPPKGPR
ncbi:MAG: c-type cytochrome domain-containing protein [Tepidisphaeraceae bacterium]